MAIPSTYNLPSSQRHEILERDGFKCRECGSTESLEVHHIFPKQFNVDHSPQNLITLCRTCHAAKSPETQASFFSKIILFFKKQTDKILQLFNAVPDDRYQYVLDFLKIPSFRASQKEVVDHLMNNRNRRPRRAGGDAHRIREITLLLGTRDFKNKPYFGNFSA